MIKMPCYDCGERHPGCHARCEKYLAATAELAKIKEAKKEATEIRVEIGNYERDNIRKSRNR
ncbi:MAG: hypothetical protein EOM54_10325 [Clostridia bacterium]|nr:hypothetical protein [Clostridia bacterium]